MKYLGMPDYLIIGAYFLSLIVLGLYLSRKASSSLDDYFLAGRKLPWWVLGVGGMGWSVDIAGTMLIVSLLYLLGPRSLFIEFRGGVPLGLVFTMIWTGKWHRRSGCMTGAEWMSFRFGNCFGANFARIAKVIALLVFTIGMLVYMIKGVGLFFAMFIPLTPFQCSLIMIGLTTLYTIASGFYGVVFSDLLQCGLVLAGMAFITVLAVLKIANAGGDLSGITETVTGCSQWLTSFPQQFANMPKGYEVYESLFMFTIFLLLRNIIMGFGTGDDPHYFAAKNERECGKVACLWMSLSTFRWPMMISYAILGIFIVKDMFPDHAVLAQAAILIKQQLGNVTPGQWADALANIMNNPAAYPAEFIESLKSMLGSNWGERLHLLSYDGTVNAERIMPAVLLYSIPSGFRGLIFVSLLAAEMSTFDITINKAASFFTKDIYQRYLRPAAVNRELMWATYLFTIALVASGFAMAYSVKNINDIWGWITMGLVSGLSVPSLLKMYWWRFNGGGFAIGTMAGTFGAVAQRLFWPQLPEQWQFVSLTLFAGVCSIIGTYLTKPTEKQVLENFYRITRPFGFWNPLLHILPEDIRTKMKKEHKNDLLAVPFVGIWLVTMFLMPMQLIIKQYKAFNISLGLFVLSIIFIYIFWYKNLPSVEDVRITEKHLENQNIKQEEIVCEKN
ncbi:MAG: sodium:solute symporter [Planctomycetes bacterium GWF2_41_51]|nr:MAG: sodium:solute symporter [Planctomycetes bacterium GWF2_41_51]